MKLFSSHEGISDLSDKLVHVTKMTATEASRNFSALLNRVAAGERIEITRAGAVVAVVSSSRPSTVTLSRLKEILAAGPPLDDAFAGELREIRKQMNEDVPSEWPS